MFFKKKNQLQIIEHDFKNLPANQNEYKKQRKSQISLIYSKYTLFLGTVYFALLSPLSIFLGESLFIPIFFALMLTLCAVPLIYIGVNEFYFTLNKFIFQNRYLEGFKVKTIEEKDHIKIQLIQYSVVQFNFLDKVYYNQDNILHQYLLNKKAHYQGLKPNYEEQIVEEKTFNAQQDVTALEYAAKLKIEAEEMNTQIRERAKEKLGLAIEQAKCDGLPAVESQDIIQSGSQDIKLLHQSVKHLVS